MSWIRITLLTVAVAGVAVLAGALADPPDKAAPKPAPVAEPANAPAVADPAAVKALEAAVKELDRTRMTWIETAIWQRVDVPGMTVQSEGVYLAGPDNQLHLDLTVRLGDAVGKMEYLCDGTTLWQIMKFDRKEPTVTKVDLKKVQEMLNAPGATPQLRDDYMQNWAFAGIAPLIQGLQQRMVFTKSEAVRWKDRDTVKLSGVWSPQMTAQFMPDPKGKWPANLPRRCFIYLDAKTHWPYRLEWWGPSPLLPQDSLLFQMEFRDPKFAKLSPERCKKEFQYSKNDRVSDETSKHIQQLNSMIQQLRR